MSDDLSREDLNKQNNQDGTPKSKIGDEIDLFVKHINAIGEVLIGLVIVMQELQKESKEKLTAFIAEHCKDDENDPTILLVPNLHHNKWKQLHSKYEHLSLSSILLPRSLLVSLISQYDAYLGRLLRSIILCKPELLNGSEKNFTFSTLFSFKSLDEARDHILEKEIEGVLRLSHAEQFTWMEKKFDLTLTKDLKSWSSFIELTERRNLFVHTDGIVSSQYISSCRKHNYPLATDLNEGQRLGVSQSYFQNAHSVIIEIGVKLGHVLWRKLFSNEREQADIHLGNITYDLIDQGNYTLAINILDFVCKDIKNFYNEAHRLTFIINRAQAYKWDGNDELCKKIMKGEDWSAKDHSFKLAEAVLSDNWKRACSLVRQIGKKGQIRKDNYLHWPLFKELRKQEEFHKAYADVYGEEFNTHTEKTNIPSQDQLLNGIETQTNNSENKK